MILVLFSRGQISRCKIAHLIWDSGQDHPSAGNGELCIIRNGNVNASIVSNALLSLFRRRLTKRSGWGRGRGDGQTDPRVNILIQMPTDFFYDRDISQLPHWERVRGGERLGRGDCIGSAPMGRTRQRVKSQDRQTDMNGGKNHEKMVACHLHIPYVAFAVSFKMTVN